MAMHASNELSKVITILGEQLHQLGIEMDAAILNEKVEGSKDWHMWLAIPSGSKELYTRVEQVRVPYKRMAAFDRIYRSDSQGLSVFSDYHNKAQKDLFFRHYFKNSNHLDVPKARKDYIFSCPGLSRTTILSKNSFIQYFRYSKEVFSTEDKQVLERFGHVFEQSYTRFLDLQKAEAQAREAQIEAALERVRSKTMAMHNSQDVGETVVTLFDEVLHLGLDKSIRCGIGILQGNNRMETWSATYDAQNKVDLVMGTLDMTIHPLLMGTLKAWKNKEPDHSYELVGEEVIKYYRGLNNEPDYPFQVDLATLPERIYNRSFYFSEGLLFSFTSNPLTEEAAGVLRRFAGVFGQTYRRYLDLKKAEEQAREAQIEAALERIRARALAMHNSDELADVANVLREQMGLLNQPELETSSIQLYHRGTKTIESWFAFRLPGKTKGKFQSGTVHIPFESSLVSQKWANLFYSKKTEYTIRIAGQELQEWLAVREKGTPEANYGKGEPPSVLYAHFSKFSGGALVMVTLAEPTENSKLLQKRAAVVFDLAYKRFRDLQKSEAQAVEAIKQASVDRVRGEISGMRSTADLERITPLIWRELTTLGVPFFRCGVFIVDDADKHVNVYLSAPDGHSLGAMRFVFDANTLTSKIVAHWRKGKIYKEHWSQQDFIAWTKDLKSQNQIQDERTYQDSDTPPESLHLHFIPFKQGMLYVGNAQKLEANEIGLVQSLAAAFEMAYARYEDFIRLEKAKSGIEAALGELKATQAQLIQSEKMASLGELTAGIAHEIQNPLNFVNNFSELNAELLEELGQEIEAGNMEEVKALAGDIKQNEVKISHHGKRAESIVKGMLQHSRSSSGVKELADINVLCDEYLRLSYHGLRAKDKSFNADFKVDFEEALPEVKIVPQDIGRVLLNLINNAFYAVDKKAKAGEGNFKPEVLIVTRKQGAAIEIKVMDNGDGISKGMREKIFQPFFTTKPTGQGTGLGLSLSYDIVKAHGGDLRMNTREGMGSEFIIQLPVTNNS
jgi:signal transduction histidine kinase